MKKHANTLYITTEGAYLFRRGEELVVRIEDENRFSMPIHTLDQVTCFGAVTASPFCLQLCCENGVSVTFLDRNGRFMARVEGPVSGNVLLRQEQYRLADQPQASSRIAAQCVIGKIANCRQVLLRSIRNRDDDASRLQEVEGSLSLLLHKVQNADATCDEIRGMEGDAAAGYFSVFDDLITSQKGDFFFRKRTRRPPLDRVNAMLSFVYSIVANDVRSACESVGLDPQVGFLHRPRPGRSSLALDLMEELRPALADRLVLTLINRQQVAPDGFKIEPEGSVMMDDETRKTVLVAYQKRKAEEMTHPFLGEKITIGLLPHIQARLLARYVRGDLEAYPPVLWR